MRRPRRNHTAKFKAKVAVAALKGDKTLAEITEEFDVHANQIVIWKQQLLESAETLFSGSLGKKEVGPDMQVLHAKIGELTLENDFLEQALNKAGLRSAKK
jgi:transposase